MAEIVIFLFGLLVGFLAAAAFAVGTLADDDR